jgi:hypothetical protein
MVSYGNLSSLATTADGFGSGTHLPPPPAAKLLSPVNCQNLPKLMLLPPHQLPPPAAILALAMLSTACHLCKDVATLPRSQQSLRSLLCLPLPANAATTTRAAHHCCSRCHLYVAAVIVAIISSTHSACSCCCACCQCSHPPVDHHHLPLPLDCCCHCCRTAVATDTRPLPR